MLSCPLPLLYNLIESFPSESIKQQPAADLYYLMIYGRNAEGLLLSADTNFWILGESIPMESNNQQPAADLYYSLFYGRNAERQYNNQYRWGTSADTNV